MTESSWSSIVVRDDPANAIRRVVIDNPPLGVLNQDVRRELGTVFLQTQSDLAIRCLVFGSGPRSFCAGADLREFAMRFDPLVARAHIQNAQRMILALVELDVPVIASIHGACMGGGLELALGCTYRIAARSARLALPEVNRGAWPGTGGCLLLSRQVRPALSKRLLYTGETLDAATACSMGVIDEVVDDEALEARTQAVALSWAAQPGSSIRRLTTLVDRDFRARFRSHLQFEAECFVQAYQTPAAREGYQAFFEKRAPRWEQA